MNEQRTSNAVRILERVVTMVPGMTVLSRLEVVCEGLLRRNRTLRNTVDAVRCICMELTDAVPMDCASVVLKIVGNMNSLGGLTVSTSRKAETRHKV